MNFNLVVVNSDNTFFSGIKLNSPKMYNTLSEQCKYYKNIFNSDFRVKRVIPTKQGWKFI
jgi:hypothetical protein